jgi:DNA-binding LacI/PurR family transcriptional regulator
MSDRTIVVIYDQSDDKRAEISVLDNAHKAARLVETLLEAGFEKERIRIFTGAEMEMQVTHRPVVALVGGEAPGETHDKAIDAPAEHEAEPEEALPRAKAELQEAGVNVTPGVRDGVRFSSLFRPA